MLIKKRVVKIAVLDPNKFLGWATIRIFSVNAGHAAVEFYAKNLVTALIGQMNAKQILGVILSIDNRFGTLAIGTNDNRLVRSPAPLGGKLLVPSISPFQ